MDDKGLAKGKVIGIRHLQCLLVFFAIAVSFSLRVNLSMAIVAMTDTSNKDPNAEIFDWNEQIKSLLLGSFLWGYIITQVPGGYLAQRFGAKFVLLAGIALCSLITIVTPWFTLLCGSQFLIASRILQGLCQGVVFPSCHALLSKWCPKEERGVLATFAYSGNPFGTVIMLATSGVLSSNLGWQSIFYVSGAAGLVWSAVWYFFGSSSPADCKMVSTEEKHLIESSLGRMQEVHGRKLSTPWCKLFTSPPFLALILVHCANNWGYWTLLTQIPSYMKGVLGMDINSNALLSSVPYFAMLILSLLFVVVAKVLAKKNWLSIEMERKAFNTIGHWTPMATLIGLGFVTSEVALAVALLTIAVGFNSAIHLGFQVNHIDLAPNYAGTMMGITNGLGNVLGLLAPLAVSVIVTNEVNSALFSMPTETNDVFQQHDVSQWRYVFFIAAGFYFIGNLVFLIFGTTRKQSWNNPEAIKSQKKNVEELTAIRSGPEGDAY